MLGENYAVVQEVKHKSIQSNTKAICDAKCYYSTMRWERDLSSEFRKIGDNIQWVRVRVSGKRLWTKKDIHFGDRGELSVRRII